MSQLLPWANGPFELLVHAEGHFQGGQDFDRRIALISVDDAIEVSITTYLTLHPALRGNRAYSKANVEQWLHNYHTKLDFIDEELKARGLAWTVSRNDIIWVHDHRNEQYHGGTKGIPEIQVLKLVRGAALWIFGLLYEVPEADQVLQQTIVASRPPAPPQRDSEFDRAIDNEFGLVLIGGYDFTASEVLFAVDYDFYRETGAILCDRARVLASAGASE